MVGTRSRKAPYGSWLPLSPLARTSPPPARCDLPQIDAERNILTEKLYRTQQIATNSMQNTTN